MAFRLCWLACIFLTLLLHNVSTRHHGRRSKYNVKNKSYSNAVKRANTTLLEEGPKPDISGKSSTSSNSKASASLDAALEGAKEVAKEDSDKDSAKDETAKDETAKDETAKDDSTKDDSAAGKLGGSTDDSKSSSVDTDKPSTSLQKLGASLSDDLPSLEKLLKSGTDLWNKDGNNKKFKILGCELSVRIDGCKMVIIPEDKKCKDALSLATVTKVLMKDDRIKEVAGRYVPFEVFQLERLKVNNCKNTVVFVARAKERFDIIKERLKLRRARLSLDFEFKNPLEEFKFEKLGIDIRGNIKMGGDILPLSITKKIGSADGQVLIRTKDSLNITDFTSRFIDNFRDDVAFIGSELFTRAAIKNPEITGTRDRFGAFEVIATGELLNVPKLDGSRVYVVAQKNPDEPVGVAVVVDLKGTSPSETIKAIIKKEVPEVPLIKNFAADLVVEYATGEIPFVKDDKLQKILSNYVRHGKVTTQGLKIKVPVPTRKIIDRTGTISNTKNLPDLIYLQINILDGILCFTFPEGTTFDLLTALGILTPKVPDFLFHKVVKNPPSVVIKRFDINLLTNEIALKINAPRSTVLGDDLLVVENADFTLRRKAKGAWDFEIDAKKTFRMSTMNIKVQRVGDNYQFTGKINELTSKALIDNFAAPSAEVDNKLGNKPDKVTAMEEYKKQEATAIFDQVKFLDFWLRDVEIVSVFGDKSIIKVNARPVFFDWETHFEAFFLNQEKERAIVFGIVFKGIKLDEFVFNLFGKRLVQLAWMKDLTATIIASNTDKSDGIDFSGPLKGGNVKKGITFETKLLVPDECRREPLCEVIKDKLKTGAELNLKGDVTATGLNLRASYTGRGVSFGDNLLMLNVSLVVGVGYDGTAYFFEGEMRFIKQKLSFNARMGLSAVGTVEMGLELKGLWNAPFGLEYFQFAGVAGSIDVTPGAPIPKLQLTGKMTFGKLTAKGPKLVSDVSIGFSASNPNDNFFYAPLSKITIGSLVEALDITVELPEVLVNTLFPEGLIVGFSTNPKGKEVEALSMKLTSGIVLQGKVSTLGFDLDCKILVNVPEKLEFRADMTAVDFNAGLIKLRRSKADKQNGPSLYSFIAENEASLKMSAYAEMLGMAAEVSIEMTNFGMFFNIYGNLFNLVETNLTVDAAFSPSVEIHNTEFYIYGCLQSALQDVTTESKKTIIDAADSLAGAVQETEGEMKKAGSWYDRATKKLAWWNGKMELKQKALDRKSAKMDTIILYLNSSCVDRCPDVCLGGFVLRKKCKQLFGKWQSCPEWDECKTKVADPLCLARCKAKKLGLHFEGLRQKLTMMVLEQSIKTIMEVEESIHDFVNAAQEFTNLVEEASVKLEQASASGKKAIFAIANYSKEKLIEIHSICLNSSVTDAQDGCFTFMVNLTLGGKRNLMYDINACLEVNFAKDFGKLVAEQIFPGISSIQDILKQAKEYFKDAKSRNDEMFAKAKETDDLEKQFEGKLEKMKMREELDPAEMLQDTGLPPEQEEEKEKEEAEKLEQKQEKEKLEEESEEKKDPNDVFSDGEKQKDDKDIQKLRNKEDRKEKQREEGKDKEQQTFSKRDEKYIRHQIYGDFPSIVIRDDATIDAFNRKSAWAYSETESPFEERDVIPEGSDPDPEPAATTSVLDNLMKGTQHANNCTSTRNVIETYRAISDSLTQLVNNAVEQEEKYHTSAKAYGRQLADTETEIKDQSRRMGFSAEDEEDALFYIQKLKNGTSQWLRNVDSQLVSLDKEILNQWRKSFLGILMDKTIDVTSFVNTLMRQSLDAEKRLTPNMNKRNVFGGNIVLSTKIINDLITSGDAPLSSKRDSIEKLREHVAEMSNVETEMNCQTEEVSDGLNQK